MAEDDSIVLCACRLPLVFYREGTISIRQLAREAGLADHPECLTLPAIKSVLRQQPELMDQWLRWSEDKRVSEGWYLTERDGEFIVGHLPDWQERRYSDRIDACAEFITREIDSFLSNKLTAVETRSRRDRSRHEPE